MRLLNKNKKGAVLILIVPLKNIYNYIEIDRALKVCMNGIINIISEIAYKYRICERIIFIYNLEGLPPPDPDKLATHDYHRYFVGHQLPQ